MTQCPMCKGAALQATHYNDNLPMHECPQCGGAWLRSNEYMLWLKRHPLTPADLNALDPNTVSQLVHDSEKAALCPDCGRFMRKYKVNAHIPFQLDRCNHCNGVWFDRNEWQVLKTVNLHDEINQIFTQPWQKRIQDELTAEHLEAIYLRRFGQEDYQKIQEIRKWLDEHPNRSHLLAFLMDENPYKT